MVPKQVGVAHVGLWHVRTLVPRIDGEIAKWHGGTPLVPRGNTLSQPPTPEAKTLAGDPLA
jgi:hypothetical protein